MKLLKSICKITKINVLYKLKTNLMFCTICNSISDSTIQQNLYCFTPLFFPTVDWNIDLSCWRLVLSIYRTYMDLATYIVLIWNVRESNPPGMKSYQNASRFTSTKWDLTALMIENWWTETWWWTEQKTDEQNHSRFISSESLMNKIFDQK